MATLTTTNMKQETTEHDLTADLCFQKSAEALVGHIGDALRMPGGPSVELAREWRLLGESISTAMRPLPSA